MFKQLVIDTKLFSHHVLIFTTSIQIRLQLGLSTYSFPWTIEASHQAHGAPFTASGLLNFASDNNIRYVQFGDNMPLDQFSKEQLSELRQKADKLNLNLQVGARRLTRENIERYLSIAEQMKSPFLRVVIDDTNFHPDEQQVVEIIKTLLPELKRTGICLAIENHDRFPSTTLRRIIEETDPISVGICLDTANSLGANEGINEVMQVLGAYTVNLHIKDITISRLSHKMGFLVEGCPAGTGLLNIPSVIDEMKGFDRCKTVTLEVWSQPGATIEETVAKEKQWVQTSIEYLKNILA